MKFQYFRRRQTLSPQSQINITPFVDVMLVLLIVFMVTAPLLTVGIEVNLPKASLGTLGDPEKPMILSINKDGVIYIGSEAILPENLIAKINALSQDNPNRTIFLRGDQDALYGNIMDVIARLNESGYGEVSLVTSNETSP